MNTKGNINTKEYWEDRFRLNWKKNGEMQTKEYAKENVKHLNIPSTFEGKILDFGCALGDAIPVYSSKFPKASIIGTDISENAINLCNIKYGTIAKFIAGSNTDVPIVDIIIASHVMEHLTNDRIIVKSLLERCKDLYVIVPFKENPLFIEHVNYYDVNYYDEFMVKEKKVFRVEYKKKVPLIYIFVNLLKFRFVWSKKNTKEVILFHIMGLIE